MSKKIKNKVVQATIRNRDVIDLFQGVLGIGGGDFNIEIVYPKYRKVAEHCSRFLRLLETFLTSALMKKFPAEAALLADHAAALRKQEAATFRAPDLEALHPPGLFEKMNGKLAVYTEVTREEYEAFLAAYKLLKESDLIAAIVLTCKYLIRHKKYLGDPAQLSDCFLVRRAGQVLAPLPGVAVNFKQMYVSDRIDAAERKLILMILHKMFRISHDVYDTMSSPDVDVNEFVQIVMTSIGEMRRQIPRCTEAFDKIVESVNLLKENFGGYYKDFIATSNPMIIMENFVVDVSKTTKAPLRVTGQFQKIIRHYRKMAQQVHSPKLKTLFQQIDKNFQELEKCSREADHDEEDGEDGEDGGDGERGACGGAD